MRFLGRGLGEVRTEGEGRGGEGVVSREWGMENGN